jgi:hypothetical protein
MVSVAEYFIDFLTAYGGTGDKGAEGEKRHVNRA